MAIFAINLLSLILFAIDRVLKYLFIIPGSTNSGIFLLGDFFQLRLSLNRGIVFGYDVNFFIILILYIIIIVLVVFYLFRAYQNKQLLNIFGLTLVLAGGISNLIDRLKYGAVIDYFDLKYFSVFNLADAMICIGVAILIIFTFKKSA